MKEAPRLRGGIAIRTVALFVGLALIAAAIVAALQAGIGLPPWDVLHIGIARHAPVTFGQAGIAVGLVIVVIAWALGYPPGFGTVANAIAIGLLIDVFRSIGWVEGLVELSLPGRVGLLLGGVALFATGSALYIGAGLGAGPRDSLMLVVSRRTGARIGLVRAAIEVSVLACGIALGGKAGVGTVVVALLIGPSVEGAFWLVLRLRLAHPGGERPMVVATEP